MKVINIPKAIIVIIANNDNNISFSHDNNDKSYDWSYVLPIQAFFKTSFLWLWVSEAAAFKILRLLLNLFQINGPINKMLFWAKLLFIRGVFKVLCDLV